MALVDYTSSDESDNNEDSTSVSTTTVSSPNNLKRKCGENHELDTDLPPLPSQFHDLYASTTRASTRDDPSLHGGRKRATPHVEGNWPTHLYIEWYPQTSERGVLNQLIASIQVQEPNKPLDADVDRGSGKITSFLTSDLGAPLPLHISLSKPIGFKTEAKDGFVAALQRRVAGCGVRPFKVQALGIDWVPNFESTRWFLVLRLRRPSGDELNKLLRVCNSVVEEWGQGPLYSRPSQLSEAQYSKNRGKIDVFAARGTSEDEAEEQNLSDSFHVSIAWTLEAPNSAAVERVRAISKGFFKEVKEVSFAVAEIKAKVGNLVTTVKLPLKVFEVPNLFGF